MADWGRVGLGVATGGQSEVWKAGANALGFGRKSSGPGVDINGELARISAMFEAMRAQNRVNINREAAQGRSAAANNLAARGTYRSPVAQGTFNQLEGERINAIANSDAQLAGQEAQLRSGLLRELLGLDAAQKQQDRQIQAGRAGAITSIGSNLLLAALMRNPAPLVASAASLPAASPSVGLPVSQWPAFQGPQTAQVPFLPTQNPWWRS